MKAYNSIAEFNHFYISKYARIEGDLRIKTDYRFINERPSTEIFKIIEKEEIDLLVIGLNDLGSLKMKLIDILNHRVLRQTITSVFLIPDNCPFVPVKNLLFAIDLHKHSTSRFILNQGIKLSRSFDASMHFLYFSSGTRDTIKDRESYEFISELVKVEKRHLLEIQPAKNISHSMQEYISANSIDCLVMVKQHRNIFENLFRPSHTESIPPKSRIPILILIEKEIGN